MLSGSSRAAQGTQIEGTFWRDAAERMDGVLREGAAYVISNGNVKPANRKFSSVANDYKIDFSLATTVREVATQVRGCCRCCLVERLTLPFRCRGLKYKCRGSNVPHVVGPARASLSRPGPP